ncbi:MAG TPA: protein-glutamate O-methyltransferase CheR [Usitatibacter sp.]|nr:protein-glutamate O-methyltransferase CheR [Usitatibacter sp.]
MDAIDAEAQLLRGILDRVRGATGLDFSRYREATMRRRVHNRMMALGLAGLEQYAQRLEADPGESRRLVERLTIKVSRFYRNAPVFDLLRGRLLAELAALRGREPLRLWSAGCGRGEEAYTLAMLLEERAIAGRVLATDIDPAALNAAHEGAYPEEAVAELPAALRERFLLRETGRMCWRANPALRARIEFCRHDLLGPLQPRRRSFDLVACRNLLIYLQRDMHEKALARLRQALADDGVLVLGEAEWPSPGVEDSLEAVAPRQRVFRAAAREVAPA